MSFIHLYNEKFYDILVSVFPSSLTRMSQIKTELFGYLHIGL